METFVTFARRCELIILRLLVSLHVLFRDLDFIAHLGMAEANAPISILVHNFLELIVEQILDLIDSIVCRIILMIYSRLRFGDIFISARHPLPLD